VATGWHHHRQHIEQMKTEISKRLLDCLRLQPGQLVLELGAGTGEFARQLAAAVGPTGRVVVTDAAAGMVALIRATTADLDNVDCVQADAAAIDQPDASFEGVVFRMGLMFLPEPIIGLREMHRVLKPGGRLGVVTWGSIENNPWLTTVGMTGMMTGLLSGPLPVSPGGPLSLGDAGRLQQLAGEAGFHDVVVEPIPTVFDVADAAEHIEHVTSLAPPLRAAYDAATEEQRASWREALAQATQQFATSDGLRVPGLALLLSATA
jgi:SAM-dependent methyltransferase